MPYALLLAPIIIHILSPPQLSLISIPYHNTLIAKQTGLSSSPHSPENFNFWPLASFCCIPVFVWSPTEPKEVLILTVSQRTSIQQHSALWYASLLYSLQPHNSTCHPSHNFPPSALATSHLISFLFFSWSTHMITESLHSPLYFCPLHSAHPHICSHSHFSRLTSASPGASVSTQAEDYLATDQPELPVRMILL